MTTRSSKNAAAPRNVGRLRWLVYGVVCATVFVCGWSLHADPILIGPAVIFLIGGALAVAHGGRPRRR